jgi:hypothetical protein
MLDHTEADYTIDSGDQGSTISHLNEKIVRIDFNELASDWLIHKAEVPDYYFSQKLF